MKKQFKFGVLLALLASLLLFGVPAFAVGQGSDQDFATDRILVKFHAATNSYTKQNVHSRQNGVVIDRIEKLGVQVVRIPKGKVLEEVNAYRSEKAVAFAEPDYVIQAHAIMPNDPGYKDQWGLRKIKAPKAWEFTKGLASVKIAILDSGIDQDHEDLADKLVANQNFTSSRDVDDHFGHGTHIAGIAAAATKNASGVAGVAYDCSLMNGKVISDNGSGQASWLAMGIIWAADNGAKVINISSGSPAASKTLQRAVDYAWSKGVVVVASAGNGFGETPSYPAYYAHCIAVTATDSSDAKPDLSKYGPWVDVAAPGVDIYSTLPNHANFFSTNYQDPLNYGRLSGSSMAAPFVAGLAGLLWSTDYGTSNANVRYLLEQTADRIAGTGTYWTYGRINAYAAVAPALSTPLFTLSGTPASQTVAPGEAASYTITVDPSGGFNEAVDLSVTGLPAGADFAPAAVDVGTTTLTVTTARRTSTGTYPLTITGTGEGGWQSSAKVTLQVSR